MNVVRALLFFGVGSALLACAGVRADAGSDAFLVVGGGDFVRSLGPRSSGGPAVLAAYLSNPRVIAGSVAVPFSGVAGPTATSVLVGLEGDVGYSRVSVTLPPPESPNAVGFEANFALSKNAPRGEARLWLVAVDASGGVGPRTFVDLVVEGNEAPSAPLEVRLSWDGPADLDLHLELPDGLEIYSEAPVYGTKEYRIGYLDVDSNANCVFDGHATERILFEKGVPRGVFEVRVATRSLCEAPSAPFSVEVLQEGTLIERVEGLGLPTDTRFGQGRGAGLLMATFEVE